MNRLLGVLVVAATALGCVSLKPSAAASQPRPSLFWYDPAMRLGLPAPESLRNANDSPRITDTTHYVRFFREHGAKLIEWAADPRIRLNPNFVAALFAKESGFDPLATSHVPANGLAQITHIADADLQIIAREATPFRWMHDEVSRWPRAAVVHSERATKRRTDSLLVAGRVGANTEYLFDPRLSMRASLFRLRVLADVWTGDEWPGQHGRLARERLGNGGPPSERDLLNLVTVSYNQGHPYAAELVRKHGRDWTSHLNDESRDYLETIVRYTEIFQRSAPARY